MWSMLGLIVDVPAFVAESGGRVDAGGRSLGESNLVNLSRDSISDFKAKVVFHDLAHDIGSFIKVCPRLDIAVCYELYSPSRSAKDGSVKYRDAPTPKVSYHVQERPGKGSATRVSYTRKTALDRLKRLSRPKRSAKSALPPTSVSAGSVLTAAYCSELVRWDDCSPSPVWYGNSKGAVEVR